MINLHSFSACQSGVVVGMTTPWQAAMRMPVKPAQTPLAMLHSFAPPAPRTGPDPGSTGPFFFFLCHRVCRPCFRSLSAASRVRGAHPQVLFLSPTAHVVQRVPPLRTTRIAGGAARRGAGRSTNGTRQPAPEPQVDGDIKQRRRPCAREMNWSAGAICCGAGSRPAGGARACMRSGGAIIKLAACPQQQRMYACMEPSSRVWVWPGPAAPEDTRTLEDGNAGGGTGRRNREREAANCRDDARAALASSVSHQQCPSGPARHADRGSNGRMAAAPRASMCHEDPQTGRQPARRSAASRGQGGGVSVARIRASKQAGRQAGNQAIKTPRS
ncbi:hypothetical protein IWX90DRAFT_231782 [Phyllosticta citrichinensis]|uniref:Uncharacterized protein n=1 Tax=Phyllosticta citrichinensis TaxID=1130410 RepID=A0ABR1XV92_9PEZI